MSRKLFPILSLFVLLAMVLGACGTPAATTTAPAATEAPAMTEAPAATEAPMATTEAPAATEAPVVTTEAPAATEAPLAPVAGDKKIILATTTSTQDSGLLDYLLPIFTQETGIAVDVIAVGTGQALKLGEDGNADVLLVHARAQEDAFMEAKHGVRREDVMYNDFVIVGDESDPAGIKGMTSAVDAFKKIAEAKSPFISRGDKSGTNTKELSIWKAAGIEPAGDWYIAAGQGMGEVLTMTEEQKAYTLSDRATYLARQGEGLKLVILVEGDKTLFNPYGVIAVNPEKNPNIQNDLANQFIDWIISVPVQEKIASFGKDKFGQSLFIPSSKPWLDSQAGSAAGEAALKVTGLVEAEKSWTEAEIKAMPTMDVQRANKSGTMETYTGVDVNELLKQVTIKPEAMTVVLVADDGFTAEVPLADITACTDCILSFRSQGGFSFVAPKLANNAQVKGLVEIQLK